jgi:pimeloyl-ACP methyl ester carboxylesterase
MAEGFQCVTLRMPLDHFHDTGKTIDVTYAIQPHAGPGRARGSFVTLTGGPGSSGIQSAVSYTESFAESVRRRYDIVFVDQRGAYLSGDMTCPDAALAFYRSTSDPATSTATTGLGADAHTFVDDCIQESGVDPGILPYLGTRQAVKDLEAIRAHLGADRLMLYGESYGTQYAQMYASAYPERIAGLFLDGPVDLSHGLLDYYDEQTRGFDEALEGTLYDCTTARPCTTDDLAPNSIAGWDALAARLDDAPIPFEFHGSAGQSERREFTRSDLDNAASSFLYSEHDRMLLQRALTAASQDDLWYLSRLLYSGLVMDPDTQEAIPEPSYSDGLYYAVECLDYAIPGDTPEKRATNYLEEGRRLDVASERLGSLFYGDLPCAYWPAQPESADRPPLLVDVPFPMFVLGATLDPATPWANGERIAASAGANAWVIVKPGGPHVIFGRGEACPDDLVTAFLVKGTLPREQRTVCRGNVATDYVRLPPLISTQYADTRGALRSADIETVNSVDYWYWDGEEPLRVGCRFGGTIGYTPSSAGTRLRLDGCSWSSGLALSGTGLIDDDAGTLTLQVRQDGAGGGPVRYRRDARGGLHVIGKLPMFRSRGGA